MIPTTINSALYSKIVDNRLVGLCATFFDDTLQAGDAKYQEITKMSLQKFKCRDHEYDKTQLSGVEIDTLKDELQVHQSR